MLINDITLLGGRVLKKRDKLSHGGRGVEQNISLIYWYVDIPDVTAGYVRLSDLIWFSDNFKILLHVWNVKLSQIVCPVISNNYSTLCVKFKSKPLCIILWLRQPSFIQRQILLKKTGKTFFKVTKRQHFHIYNFYMLS